MENKMTLAEICETLLSVGLHIVYSDSEKIIGRFQDTSMIFVYYNISKVVEKPVLQIHREHNMPVIGTGKEFYYTDKKTLVNLVLNTRK